MDVYITACGKMGLNIHFLTQRRANWPTTRSMTRIHCHRFPHQFIQLNYHILQRELISLHMKIKGYRMN